MFNKAWVCCQLNSASESWNICLYRIGASLSSVSVSEPHYGWVVDMFDDVTLAEHCTTVVGHECEEKGTLHTTLKGQCLTCSYPRTSWDQFVQSPVSTFVGGRSHSGGWLWWRWDGKTVLVGHMWLIWFCFICQPSVLLSSISWHFTTD